MYSVSHHPANSLLFNADVLLVLLGAILIAFGGFYIMKRIVYNNNIHYFSWYMVLVTIVAFLIR